MYSAVSGNTDLPKGSMLKQIYITKKEKETEIMKTPTMLISGVTTASL
jgi:hypothetical protein